MRYHSFARTAVVGALMATLGMSAVVAAAASPECDRACLQQMLSAYLTAVFKHDPKAAPLSDDHFATDNTSQVRNGEGFWHNVSGYGELQRRYFDPLTENAAFYGLLNREGKDTIVSVRIRVRGGKIAEAEWITATKAWIIGTNGPGARGEANPQGLIKYPPPAGPIAAAERSSRYAMISLANNYFQAVMAHDGSWVPGTADCIRIEDGGVTTNNPAIAGAQTAAAQAKVAAPLRGGCLANFQSMKHLTKDLALRRMFVVDEEAGVIFSSAIYVRYPGVQAPNNLVHKYFLIRDGKIAGIWNAMYFLPTGAPISNGWEDRQDP